MTLGLLMKLTVAVSLLGLAIPMSASPQQMGRDPYSPTRTRSPSMAAQFEFQERMQNQQQSGGGESASSGAIGALNQYVTSFTSTSTSVGNLNEVTQNLSGGSNGSVGQSTAQDSIGNQGSSASLRSKIDDLIKVLQGTQEAQGGSAKLP